MVVESNPPTREDYYRVLADVLDPETLVVTGLGNASYLWARLRDAPENFYLEDAMGLTLPLALGLAVAVPERQIVVVEGDGALLMHLGGLVTLGAIAPANLTALLIDNRVHGASGGQVLTSQDLDLSALARAAGIASAMTVEDTATFRPALAKALAREDGPSVLALRTAPDLDIVTPPRPFDPVAVRRRFQDTIGATEYLPTSFGGGLVDP